ncbi:MAG: glycine-rich domain-containing protein [Minisyncoccia bacterium]
MKKIVTFLSLFLAITLTASPLTVFAFSSDCTGGTIIQSGGNTIHTFTTSGTLDCTGTGGGTVQALVVAGGGGGGGGTTNQYNGGGGGAGGYQYDSNFSITSQSYSVTVGSGGGGATVYTSKGTNGGDSIFSTITSTGGGGGGSSFSTTTATGADGGSGGGAAGLGDDSNGGSGNGGAGGGGASTAGEDLAGGHTDGSDGGAGLANSISGTNVTYAGGGGGATDAITPGSGGIGGGGNGSDSGSTPGNGDPNTGGGGGGGNTNTGGSGGSGIVIISYTSSNQSITGSGIINRLVKFTASTTIGNALLSDDGSDTMLTSGNFFMPVGSLFDSVTSGILNFGTMNATTMTFGRSGQNMIINSKVGIATSTPTATLHVNGDIFGNFINVLANGLGFDTDSAGLLSFGSTTATSINIGRTNATTTVKGLLNITNLGTVSNCNSTTTPSTCGSAPAGSVAMPTGGSTLVVNTTAVTANSQIFIMEDSSLGTRLGITCNTGTGRNYVINARTSGTSFTIKSSNNPVTNKACLSYWIVN